MKSLDYRNVDMLRRVSDFGAAYQSRLNNTEIQMFAVINRAFSELKEHTTSQSSSTGAIREGADLKALARTELRADLDAIRRTARALGVTTKGLERKFLMPRSGGDAALISAAHAFAQDVAPFEQQFLDYRMPAGFIEKLKRDIEAFEAYRDIYSNGIRRHAAATASIDPALEKAYVALQQLDGIVANLAAGDPVMKAAWDAARHVVRRASRPRAATAVSAAPVPTPAAQSAA